MENTIDVPMRDVRDIKTITAEIRTLTKQAQKQILNYAIEIGRRLCEAKSMLPHGQWGNYLKEEVEFSQSTANNFMKIFEEYGAEQLTLDGAVAKSQTIGNLTYSKALKLLALPAEERESFVVENDVDAMSARQLEQAIRERDEARSSLADAQDEKQRLERSLNQAKLEAKNFEQKQKEASVELKRKLEAAQKAQKEAVESAERAKSELEELRKKPALTDTELANIRNEAIGEAKKELQERSQKEKERMVKLEDAAKMAQAEADRAAAETERLRKQLSLADADATEFKVRFESLQEAFNKLHSVYLRIEASNAEQAEKLKKAISAVVESFGKRLEG